MRPVPHEQYPGNQRADSYSQRDPEPGHGPSRQAGRVEDVDDEPDSGDDVEEAMRKDGPDDRRPAPRPAADMPRQDHHASDLPDPTRERGVPE
jgi:hypothetical protein